MPSQSTSSFRIGLARTMEVALAAVSGLSVLCMLGWILAGLFLADATGSVGPFHSTSVTVAAIAAIICFSWAALTGGLAMGLDLMIGVARTSPAPVAAASAWVPPATLPAPGVALGPAPSAGWAPAPVGPVRW